MRIIASDYDGTLNYGGIDEEKRAAIAAWRKAGNLFGLVSGRSIGDLLLLTEEFGVVCDFLLADSGATLARPDGQILLDVRCPGPVARPLVAALMAGGSQYCGVRYGKIYHVRPTQEQCAEGEFTPETLPEVAYFTQINTQHADSLQARQMVEAVKKEFGDFVNPLQNEEWIDIVPAGMNKAVGLYRLIAHLGAKPEDLITVGDNLNDADMIREFRSYAVENAHPDILRLANHVTPSVTELIRKELQHG